MRPIDTLVIHCSATPNGRWVTARDIDAWHQKRGFRREPPARLQFNPELMAIGYHHVIYTNGALATGRAHEEVGAHALHHNARSIGICMVGTDRFSAGQWHNLCELIRALTQPQGKRPARYPNARIVGHRDLSPDRNGNGVIEPQEWLKTCPGFDVATWLAGGMALLPDHLLTDPLFPQEPKP